MPNGQPYPGAWTFAYPVAPPQGQSPLLEASAVGNASTVAQVVASTIQVSESAPAVSAASVEIEKPKFFELKPVVQVIAASSVDEAQAPDEPVESIEALDEPAESNKSADEPADALENTDVPRFEISSALVSEPQTNSIVIAQPEDPLSGDFFVDEGHFVRTGSIEIVPIKTGEISIVSETSDVDRADDSDAASSFVSAISPVTASEVLNSRETVKILPKSGKRAKDSSSTSLTLMISIFVVATLATIAYFFGFFG